MQVFSDFSENMKNWSKRWNFRFWGAESCKKSLLRGHDPWIFSDFSEKFSDQVARKPDFWLRTCNNDLKQKDDS